MAGIVEMSTMMVPTMAARFTSPLSRVIGFGPGEYKNPETS
jgi:hypothetical protein